MVQEFGLENAGGEEVACSLQAYCEVNYQGIYPEFNF